MEREMLSQVMAMGDMVMVDTVLHLSLSPSPITAMVDHSPTAMEVMVDMVMERDLLMLSQDMDTPPAMNTDHHRDFPDMEVMGMVDMVMDLMVMEREMLSPVMDTELVTVLPLLLTIHMVDPALPTEAPRVFLDTAMVVADTERDLLSPVK